MKCVLCGETDGEFFNHNGDLLCESCENENTAAKKTEGIEDIRREIDQSPSGEYVILKTSFHGGGEVFRGSENEVAEKLYDFQDGNDCTCGCYGIVPVEKLSEISDNNGRQHSPYSLMR